MATAVDSVFVYIVHVHGALLYIRMSMYNYCTIPYSDSVYTERYMGLPTSSDGGEQRYLVSLCNTAHSTMACLTACISLGTG